MFAHIRILFIASVGSISVPTKALMTSWFVQ
jgi:hypothetical protein